MAPEVVENVGHNIQADIWALGVLLCEMVGGFIPFADPSPKKTYENIVH